MSNTLEDLQAERATLLKQVGQTPDMRAGSITEHYDCCGKKECCCHNTYHPGHGPYYAFTKKVAGKTKTLQMRPGPLLSKIQREVQTYQEFRRICGDLVRLNEKICDLRPIQEVGNPPADMLKKKSYRRSKKK